MEFSVVVCEGNHRRLSTMLGSNPCAKDSTAYPAFPLLARVWRVYVRNHYSFGLVFLLLYYPVLLYPCCCCASEPPSPPPHIYSGWIRRGKRVIMSFGPFLPSSTQSPLEVIFRNASLAVMMVDGEPLVVSVSCWLVKYTNYLRVLPLRRRRGVSKIISFQSEHQQQQQHNLPPHLSLILCWGLCSKRTLWQSRRGELIEHVH